VHNFTISLDGYGAGPLQTREEPLGVGGEALHDWFIPTRAFQRINGKDGGTTGVDDDIAARFGEASARGSWDATCSARFVVPGPMTPGVAGGGRTRRTTARYFVLTHHARPPIQMEGGTVFHFVTGGPREALERATAAAEGKDVQIGGGVATIRQYLEAGLIDELHVAIAPRLLGSGEHLLYGLDLTALGYECTTHVPTAAATHIVLTKRQ
jgi:dihydrofolate reductase